MSQSQAQVLAVSQSSTTCCPCSIMVLDLEPDVNGDVGYVGELQMPIVDHSSPSNSTVTYSSMPPLVSES